MRTLIPFLVALWLHIPSLASSATAEVDSIQVKYGWDEPTHSSPILAYYSEMDHGQIDTRLTTKGTFTIPDKLRTRFRVRAEDVDNRLGDWSEWSNWYPKEKPTLGDAINIYDPYEEDSIWLVR